MNLWRKSARRRRLLDFAVNQLRRLKGRRLPSVPMITLFSIAWGNPGYSATIRFLRHDCRMAAANRGNLLECGSGASTLLIGILADHIGFRLTSLEHDAHWCETMRGLLKRYGVGSVNLIHAPLVSHGDYHWYAPGELRDAPFAGVICDGPPAATPGGRFGMLPAVRSRLTPDCVILLDDTHRRHERRIIAAWRTLHPLHVASFFALKSFCRISLETPRPASAILTGPSPLPLTPSIPQGIPALNGDANGGRLGHLYS